MPDEIKAIKYPTNFRPEIIKTNLVGDINLSFSFFEDTDNEDLEIETLVKDFKNPLSKTHKRIKFLGFEKSNKENYIKMHCFDFLPDKIAGNAISYEPRSSKKQSHYEEFYNEYIEAGKIKNMHVLLSQVIYHKGEFMRNGYYPGTCITNGCDGSE